MYEQRAAEYNPGVFQVTVVLWGGGKQRRNRKASWQTDKTWSEVMAEARDRAVTNRKRRVILEVAVTSPVGPQVKHSLAVTIAELLPPAVLSAVSTLVPLISPQRYAEGPIIILF